MYVSSFWKIIPQKGLEYFFCLNTYRITVLESNNYT